jgi:hypothetical protein
MIDSVALRQDSFYDEKGITAISNNNAVVSRDQGGNVLVQPTSSLLVIEAITTNVLAESILPLLNTQFTYFKFPARTAIVDETLDLDLDLNLDLSLDLETEIAVVESNIPNTPPTPSTYKPAANEQVIRVSKSSGDLQTDEAQPIDFSIVTQGPAQSFNDSFTITQELADQGNNLKISGTIKTQYNARRNSEVGFFLAIGQDGVVNGSGAITNIFYPSNVNNNNKVTDPGVYTTSISDEISNQDLLNLVGQSIYVLGFAEDQDENRNHTILADQTFVKFESV